MIDSFTKERRPSALILSDQPHVGQEILQSLGAKNWESVVADFEHATEKMSVGSFDVVVIVSKRSKKKVLRLAENIRNQPTRTRVATILVISDEFSLGRSNLSGIDRVVKFEAGLKDIVLHIAQAATLRLEKNRLGRKESFVT